MDSKAEINFTFTIDFTFFLSQSRWFKTLPTLGTSEAVFVPGLEETNEYKFEGASFLQFNWDAQEDQSKVSSCVLWLELDLPRISILGHLQKVWV